MADILRLPLFEETVVGGYTVYATNAYKTDFLSPQQKDK